MNFDSIHLAIADHLNILFTIIPLVSNMRLLCVRISEENIEALQDLVRRGIFPSRGEAIRYAIRRFFLKMHKKRLLCAILAGQTITEVDQALFVELAHVSDRHLIEVHCGMDHPILAKLNAKFSVKITATTSIFL